MTEADDVARLLAQAERRLSRGPAVAPAKPPASVIEALHRGRRPVVLAGPGVVVDGCVDGLRALAAAANLGVLNTWGAKGVFDWRSPHHLATAGLQARDFELGGLADADLIVATGIDLAEAPAEQWRLAPVVEVEPAMLAPLARLWTRPAGPIDVPPLRSGLAAVTQEGWASTTVPLMPALVTRHYAAVLGAGGLVAADPGVAGYWIARTFATTELGGAQVTADADADGFAVACCLAARLREPGRLALAVVDDPVRPAVTAMLDEAGRRGVVVPVEVWSPDGDRLDPDEHLERLRAIVASERPVVVGLATDAMQLDRMIEVAGQVIAWAGRRV